MRCPRFIQINYRIQTPTAISAGVAVGLIGESSLRDDFKILSSNHGLPEMPDSLLVLKCRDGVGKSVSLAMTNAIVEAFGRP